MKSCTSIKYCYHPHAAVVAEPSELLEEREPAASAISPAPKDPTASPLSGGTFPTASPKSTIPGGSTASPTTEPTFNATDAPSIYWNTFYCSRGPR